MDSPVINVLIILLYFYFIIIEFKSVSLTAGFCMSILCIGIVKKISFHCLQRNRNIIKVYKVLKKKSFVQANTTLVRIYHLCEVVTSNVIFCCSVLYLQ